MPLILRNPILNIGSFIAIQDTACEGYGCSAQYSILS
jgi:hypothetical protein